MRVAVYTDYVYRAQAGTVYGERAFALFVARLSERFDQVVVVGRLEPQPGQSHYPLPSTVQFAPLPHYASLTRPIAVFASLLRSIGRFWREIADVDRVWLLGPYPHAVAFALVTLARRRPLILGVRQDFPQYVRSRRPGRRWMHLAADILELSWRLLARRCPTVVVGADLAARYRHAPRLLDISVSLIGADDIAAGRQAAAARSYEGELTMLSVGRLDAEKNPLLLADVLARLREAEPRWRLLVCGDGPLRPALAERLAGLGLEEFVELRGYVPLHQGLLELYRSSHVFLHVSLTEGVPQVLAEAFASGTPVVATDVGGVRQAVGDAGSLIPACDGGAAAAAVSRVAHDGDLRHLLIERGFELARARTIEQETGRVATFISE